VPIWPEVVPVKLECAKEEFPKCAFENAALFIPMWLKPTWLELIPLIRAPDAIERLPLKFEPPKFPKCVLAFIEESAELREIAELRPAKFPLEFNRAIAEFPPAAAPAVFPREVANDELPRPVIGDALLPNECHCPSAVAPRGAVAERFPPATLEFIPRFPAKDRLLNAGMPIGRPFPL
jgi:hypothetical protein